MIDIFLIDNDILTFKERTKNSLNVQKNIFTLKEINIRELKKIQITSVDNDYVLFLYNGIFLKENAISEINKIINNVKPAWVSFYNNKNLSKYNLNNEQPFLQLISKLNLQGALLISKELLNSIDIKYDGLKYSVLLFEIATKAMQKEQGYFYGAELFTENINRDLNSNDQIFVDNLIKDIEKYKKNNPDRFFKLYDNLKEINDMKKKRISIIYLDGCKNDINTDLDYEKIECNPNDSYYDRCVYGINKASCDYLMFINNDFKKIIEDNIYSMIYLSSLSNVGAVSPMIGYKDEIQYTGLFSIFSEPVSIKKSCIDTEVRKELENCRDTHSLSSNIWIATKKNAKLLTEISNKNSSQDAVMYEYSRLLNDRKHNVITCGEIIVESNNPIKNIEYDNFFEKINDYRYKFVYDIYTKYNSYKLNEWTKNNTSANCEVYLPETFNSNDGKNICIISHELSLTGAPIVLLEGIKLLLKNNYRIYMFSLLDGPLKKDLLDLGIPVTIVGKKNKYINWDNILCYFDFCLVNTVAAFKEIEKLNKTNSKVVWWLHDAKQGYEEHLRHVLPKELNNNIEVYAVSEYAKKACVKYRPKYNIRIMSYGIKDYGDGSNLVNPYKTDKKVFLCIGTIIRRKGQDILAEAIELLPDSIRNNCLFVFVGAKSDAKIYEKLYSLSKKYLNNIEIIEKIDHDKMLAYSKYAYAVVCPSRDDPLPTVMTETMMLSNVCICSENTGTASLINNRKNAYLYHRDSAKKLAKCIIDCYKTQNHDEMKKLARKTYLDNFTLDVYERKLLEIFK